MTDTDPAFIQAVAQAIVELRWKKQFDWKKAPPTLQEMDEAVIAIKAVRKAEKANG